MNLAEIKFNQALGKTFVLGEYLCEMEFLPPAKERDALERSKEHWRLDQTQTHTS